MIKGGSIPKGAVKLYAAKNSVLPILACCTLTSCDIEIANCKPTNDILDMLALLQSLGSKVQLDGDSIFINCQNLNTGIVPRQYAKKMRASVFLLGPLSVRTGLTKMGFPGGCNIGRRPIDIHINGLNKLGFDIEIKDGELICTKKFLSCGQVHLPFASVGATENIMMAASGIKGITTIKNAAQEPEVEDLAKFINALGGDIEGAGTHTIVINGGKSFNSIRYTPIADRIVAGTYLALAASIPGSDICIEKSNALHLQAPLKILQDKGCNITISKDAVRLKSNARQTARKRIVTRPYPGFPTDLQAQFMVMESVAKGQTTIVENLFENRFNYCKELKNLGANIKVVGNSAKVIGVPELVGNCVNATDLRGGAALVLAGVIAKGQTTVSDIYHIDRGYYNIESELSNLGVSIKRLTQI